MTRPDSLVRLDTQRPLRGSLSQEMRAGGQHTSYHLDRLCYSRHGPGAVAAAAAGVEFVGDHVHDLSLAYMIICQLKGDHTEVNVTDCDYMKTH